jgi:hypothetical protein
MSQLETFQMTNLGIFPLDSTPSAQDAKEAKDRHPIRVLHGRITINQLLAGIVRAPIFRTKRKSLSQTRNSEEVPGALSIPPFNSVYHYHTRGTLSFYYTSLASIRLK